MIQHQVPVLLWFWLPWSAALLYAVAAGGDAERAAVLLLVAAAAATKAVRPDHGVFAAVPRGILVVDTALFAGLVALSVRTDRRWPVMLSVLQGLVLLGHASKAVDPNLWALGYWILITPPQVLGILALTLGTAKYRERIRRTAAGPPWKS